MNTTLLTFLAQANPPMAPAPSASSGLLSNLIPLILIVAVLFIFIRRPANKAQAAVQGANPETKRVSKFITAGLLIGGFLGFLLRPSASIIGQLPFTVVITRGTTLQGLDQILIPAARTSFNYMIVGVIIGALVGFLMSKVMAKK